LEDKISVGKVPVVLFGKRIGILDSFKIYMEWAIS
jgi:hypothetical protein